MLLSTLTFGCAAPEPVASEPSPTTTEGTGLVLGFAGPLASIGAIAFIWGLVLRRRAYRRIRGHRFGTAPESELARALSVFGPEGLRFDLSL